MVRPDHPRQPAQPSVRGRAPLRQHGPHHRHRPAVDQDYKANNRTTSADPISDTGLDLAVDQEKNFDFYVDDIDRAQAAGSLEAYTGAAGTALNEDTEKFLFALLVAQGTAASGITRVNDPATAFNAVRDLRKGLNKAKAPAGNRILVVNAEFEALLLSNDSKLTSVDTSGDNQGLRNATIGGLLGFRSVVSNFAPEQNYPQAIAFHQDAAAFVSQIQETEGMRATDRFADRVRGLHVYGGKVVRPKGVQVYTGTATA
ncbi:P22 phage major capsid protein family protein [Curtobacterium sp. MCBA15_004]|uniref:P22 phage major capsid protein family protein n=1 Tax=Curtobacterium sp. MCBA15_004 TaxID=1898733 RepID=UPI000AB63F39|nr:P22 phage major capsid protein family protein [Curtobacterium sp. MCBA15_004]WIA96417.1 P22 phage major capsid protein family protein [Curtobacterium sp. MCBA15_004]WIA97628.1 P22 phage major capsid protein family protein [Curtobacterium sp. MCBA15_004]